MRHHQAIGVGGAEWSTTRRIDNTDERPEVTWCLIVQEFVRQRPSSQSVTEFKRTTGCRMTLQPSLLNALRVTPETEFFRLLAGSDHLSTFSSTKSERSASSVCEESRRTVILEDHLVLSGCVVILKIFTEVYCMILV